MTSHDLDLMDAQERRELLNAYIDGEVSAEQALTISTWLDVNPGALREVEHLRHVEGLLEHYADEPVPEGFADGVIEAVGIRHAAVASGAVPLKGHVVSMAWYRRPMATAAAVLVAVGATVLVMSDRGGAPAPVPSARISELEALGVEDLESLEYLDVIVDADEETFAALLADGGVYGG